MTHCVRFSAVGKAAPAGRLIRRYDNRKLYDTGERRYVTLGDLARMVGELG